MIQTLAEHVERESRGASSNTLVYICVAAAVVLAILGRGVTHGMDRSRISAYAASQGWELLTCQWKLLGPGWLGNQRERMYAITYRDAEGRTHSAFAKTSMLAGVYLTEDRIAG